MRRLLVALLGVAVFAAACGSGNPTPRRLVQVDYRSDRFGSHFWRFFPRSIDAHPGDVVDFHQTWTGEPHTVTFGTNVDKAIASSRVEDLPRFDPYKDVSASAASQPCYLRKGTPPRDRNTTCPKTTKPLFTGK